jgi:hypothetical protein
MYPRIAAVGKPTSSLVFRLGRAAVLVTPADFLCDPSRRVRRAAVEALMWDADARWPWIRLAVHHALGDAAAAGDGPLRHEGSLYTPVAVSDLTAWASEKGVLGLRAAKRSACTTRRCCRPAPTRKSSPACAGS